MNILVCSKISIPAKDRTLPAWEYLRSLGHAVTVEHPESPAIKSKPDVIISMGVTVIEETFEALERFNNVPLMCYMWDCYEWVWEPGQEGKVQARHPSRLNEYDYVRYGRLLRQAREVWVPSHCTGRRTTQWWGINHWRVILSACPWWDHTNIRDDGYALCTLREIPDRYWGRFECACKELSIPYRSTQHELSYVDYQDAVAGCRFLVSPLYELSTGGLTLLEGYRLGKLCLISNSPWHGGRDYLGYRAHYFRHDDEDHFRSMLRLLYDRPQRSPTDCQHWVETHFSDRRMIDDMLRGIKATCMSG